MATEKRLIDAARHERILQGFAGHLIDAGKMEAAEAVNSLIKGLKLEPTVDAVEVVHGEWSTIEDDYCGMTALQCSECNQEYWFENDPPIKIYNYCPNCGVKKDGGADNG